MPRTWAFTQRRKMLRLPAISQRRRRIAFLIGMILPLVLIVWLRLSARAHAWLSKVVCPGLQCVRNGLRAWLGNECYRTVPRRDCGTCSHFQSSGLGLLVDQGVRSWKALA
jgi:hypothetical protein